MKNKITCKTCSCQFEQYNIEENGKKSLINPIDIDEYKDFFGSVCFNCLDASDRMELQILSQSIFHNGEIEILNIFEE